jgi:hypothetical protein
MNDPDVVEGRLGELLDAAAPVAVSGLWVFEHAAAVNGRWLAFWQPPSTPCEVPVDPHTAKLPAICQQPLLFSPHGPQKQLYQRRSVTSWRDPAASRHGLI